MNSTTSLFLRRIKILFTSIPTHHPIWYRAAPYNPSGHKTNTLYVIPAQAGIQPVLKNRLKTVLQTSVNPNRTSAYFCKMAI